MATSTAKPNGTAEPKGIPPSTPETQPPTKTPLELMGEENETLKATIRKMVEEAASAPKPFDSYFSTEYQSQLAAKYRVKYSAIEQESHKSTWPEFAGNQHTLFILAEMITKAADAVFAANSKLLLADLITASNKYTPTANGAVLTEMQVAYNKISDMELVTLREKMPVDDQKSELLKTFAKGLKLASKDGKTTESNKLKFFHAAAALGIQGNSIW